MSDTPTIEVSAASGGADDEFNLANYAQRAYLEYALSVVKGRALPDVCDVTPVNKSLVKALQ